MTTNTNTKTVSDVITWIKNQFGDEAGVQITDTDILRWTNEAVKYVASTASILQDKVTTDVVEGQYVYALPTDRTISIISITCDDLVLKAREFNEVLSNGTLANADTKGTPVEWYKWSNDLYLLPTPDKFIEDGLTVYYVAEPANLTLSSDLLGIPDRFFMSVIYFVQEQAAILDEDSNAANRAANRMDEFLNSELNRSASSEQYYPMIIEVD